MAANVLTFLKTAGLTSPRRVLAVTYYNVVIVTENHLRFVTGRRIESERLVNVRSKVSRTRFIE